MSEKFDELYSSITDNQLVINLKKDGYSEMNYRFIEVFGKNIVDAKKVLKETFNFYGYSVEDMDSHFKHYIDIVKKLNLLCYDKKFTDMQSKLEKNYEYFSKNFKKIKQSKCITNMQKDFAFFTDGDYVYSFTAYTGVRTKLPKGFEQVESDKSKYLLENYSDVFDNKDNIIGNVSSKNLSRTLKAIKYIECGNKRYLYKDMLKSFTKYISGTTNIEIRTVTRNCLLLVTLDMGEVKMFFVCKNAIYNEDDIIVKLSDLVD